LVIRIHSNLFESKTDSDRRDECQTLPLCYTAAMSNIVAVDLGGTNLRAAYFPDDDPHPQSQTKSPTLAHEGPDAVVARIVESIEKLAPSDRRDLRIGVGVPGPLDPVAGVVFETPNLPGWLNVPLKQLLQDRCRASVVLGNDANVAALGEWRHGAARGADDVLYLTISTGIGGGVITSGRLLLGVRGLAGELGHMLVNPDGALCGCGQRGHLEAEAAGPAIARKFRERLAAGGHSTLPAEVGDPEEISAADVGRAAKQGDALARSVIEEAAQIIGRELASLVHVFNPQVIVVGGGVSTLGPLLFDPMEQALRDSIMHPAYLRGLKIVPAALGDDAGLIGAMVLARDT
jgi:glucokinase